jgi:hypothetical protein
MLRTSCALLVLMSFPAIAKELNSNKAMSVDHYIFVESSTQKNMLLLLGKTETIVSSKSENTTTSGYPVRTWVVKTQWIDDRPALRAALDKALETYPEWENYAKDREEMASAYCKFNLKDPDIKVAQGDRSTPLSSSSELCTYVIHTKDTGDEKLLQAIEQNNAIDSGLGLLKVNLKGEPKVLFDGKAVSDYSKNIIGDGNKSYSEKEAAFLLGASFAQFSDEMLKNNQGNFLDPKDQADLLMGLNLLFPRVFTTQPTSPSTYKFLELEGPFPIAIPSVKTLTFDPQSRK